MTMYLFRQSPLMNAKKCHYRTKNWDGLSILTNAIFIEAKPKHCTPDDSDKSGIEREAVLYYLGQ